MAQHINLQSMIKEAIPEYWLMAKHGIEFRKDTKIWPAPGCYGYPSALLLLSIVDSIGSYVIGGSVRKHFDILNNSEYYNLGLREEEIKLIYEKYRCFLAHNSVLGIGVCLDIGSQNDSSFEFRPNKATINLVPFLEISRQAIINFLKKSDGIVTDSEQLTKILNK